MRVNIRRIITDLQAGIVVGIVLVPVAMAYGLIAGIGPAAGLYGAVAVGLVAAVAGSSRSLIAGPNVFVALVLGPVAIEYGLAGAFTTTMLAGIILLAFAAARWGRLVAYIPYSLLAGFFTAAGIVLVITHIMPAIGLSTAKGGVIGNVTAWMDASINIDALAVAGTTVVIGLLWPRKLARYVPGPFVALVAGTAIGLTLFQAAPVVGDIPRGLPTLTTPIFNPAFVLPAFTIALLCAANGLLVALQTDSLTGGTHRPNQLLAAFGVGNLLGGFMGGNAGGASVTTFLNIQAGGRTIVSTISASLIVLLALVALPIERIPIAALAGIVIVNGYLVIDWRYVKRITKVPRGYAAVMSITAVVAVAVDFNVAVIIGLVAASLVGARRSERSELQRLISVPVPDSAVWPDGDPLESHVGLVVMPDWVSVASAREMARVVTGDIRENQVTIFDFRKVAYMDDTAATLTGQVIAGRRVALAGLQGTAKEVMLAFGNVEPGRLLSDVDEAKEAIRAGEI